MRTILHMATGMLALAATMTSPTMAEPERRATKNVVEIAAGEPSLSTLVTAVKAADLVNTLATTPNITVFAPTNDAFAKLPAGALDKLLADKEGLSNVLQYHVIDQVVTFREAYSLSEATMLNGETTKIKHRGNDVFINNAKIISRDIRASNGIVHVIDAVLLPAQ